MSRTDYALAALFAALLLPAAAAGQEGSGPAPATAATPVAAPPAVSAPAVVTDATEAETGARVVGIGAHDGSPRHHARLHDRITVKVENLPRLLAQVDGDCSRLVLFLDGMPIEGTPPESCNPTAGWIRFELDRTDASDKAWHTLLGSPQGFTRKIMVSVGPSGQYPIRSHVRGFDLVIVREAELAAFAALFLAALALFVRLARRTSLLRDPYADPGPGRHGPYSLARFQLAFWFFLVIAAYVFIWMITGELDTITGSVLALLGIGSGTALSASLIDSGKQAEAGEAAAGTTADIAVTADSTALPPVRRPAASAGFLYDVLRDDQGISLFHFQLFAWTLVLGIIFCVSVYNGLTMPSFSATVLGLMGISSGTFLGAKFPGK
jgi:hypothetical protein